MQPQKWRKIEIFSAILVFLLSYLFVAVIFFAKWPNWWEWTVPERSPMTWLQSLLLFSNALAASILVIWNYLQSDKSKMFWWALLALGFAYLMLDERFAIHERIRDLYLAPNQIKIPVFFWTSDGDFILLLYGLIAMLFIFPYFKLFQVRKAAVYWVISSFSVAVISISMDSISFKSYPRIVQNIQQFSEEILEIFVMNSFLIALLFVLSFSIQQTWKR
ncbi:hypothetical protein [Shimazuella alba]|uniref:Uncharacterized protein n=1 Tax=Shimazuella alba TaxID=2690964 RepID=A0A6I4VUK5_9BACL|nr:hypothetical protein [Shimazuella alba]MXQ53570.1 hypothetical protein [Shimazuella alba]